MSISTAVFLGQEGRTPCSLPLQDADLALGNANWTKGLQAMSDWIWSGNLNPVAFPNNLGRYLLHIPGIFEQQLNFSTTLIFDEPSFRNGIQMSGFLDRVTRELVISFIGQRRQCWYTMTHHAVLGYFTAKRHGLSDGEFAAKWTNLRAFRRNRGLFSDLEVAVLEFVEAFAFNPKEYSDDQYVRLHHALGRDNETRYPSDAKWMQKLRAAREAQALALARRETPERVNALSAEAAAAVDDRMPSGAAESMINSQIVELAFLCMQFVALSGVFTALNIPDEAFLGGVMEGLLPPSVILGGEDLPQLVPPRTHPPVKEIDAGSVSVAPTRIVGRRIPLESYELKMDQDRDKGLTVGGVQVGTYGWSFGFHSPGSLVYCLMLHPELARYEAPYSLPLLFNEDEWRNGTQTAGFVPRLLKELVYQKIYKTTRSRYGLEHHTMFLFNAYLDLYGVGRPPRPKMSKEEQTVARELALKRAERTVLFTLDHEHAPDGVFSDLEKEVLTWVETFLTKPHDAHRNEARLREELNKENQREILAGVRRLDMSPPGLGERAALNRLVNHQIAELAMLTGHMDGLGRVLTILQLHSEEAVQIIKGGIDPLTGGIKPALNERGEITPTGYFNTRPGLFDFMAHVVGVTEKAFTMNELILNPKLNSEVKRRLSVGERNFRVSAYDAAATAEF
jgi:hypothetical protein